MPPNSLIRTSNNHRGSLQRNSASGVGGVPAARGSAPAPGSERDTGGGQSRRERNLMRRQIQSVGFKDAAGGGEEESVGAGGAKSSLVQRRLSVSGRRFV